MYFVNKRQFLRGLSFVRFQLVFFEEVAFNESDQTRKMKTREKNDYEKKSNSNSNVEPDLFSPVGISTTGTCSGFYRYMEKTVCNQVEEKK
ncbi:MAG: hypothetical protein Athens101428_130 [Candidatus Berkelbacteria bacterium Athens1014_28]|uniref:Uncharacterized protein n=1 Tax=Candidatus Berkelbacteria bacterium Athens1014_28 TaxID=2017145 RepID=A0A554LPP4_9BACT|nr:MAG: hypothetical protein Athens101428_130 [Candidatus Berkelbacteria bacterium Athens1014_28]